MINVVKIYLVFTVILAAGINFSQDYKVRNNSVVQQETPSLLNTDLNNDISIIRENNNTAENNNNELFIFELFRDRKSVNNTPFNLNIISSFRNNIRFGGFWDKYTIINLTPELNIKPADYLSIYAIHNLSYFVPVKGIKQNLKSMVLRGAAIMAVDNSAKLFFSKGSILGSVIGFAAKIFLINVINRIEKNNDEKNNLQHYDYQYYSVSIRF